MLSMAARVASKFVWKDWNAPERLKMAAQTRMMASQSQAAGSRRQARRTQKARAMRRKPVASCAAANCGNSVRAMTKPETARKISTPDMKST